MQAVLGLLFFSVLLTTGASFQCETCTAMSKTCSGNQVTCPPESDACMSYLTETKAGGTTVYNIAKSCSNKMACKQQKENAKTQAPGGPVITVTCSKAPPAAASLILALSGLLMLKIFI